MGTLFGTLIAALPTVPKMAQPAKAQEGRPTSPQPLQGDHPAQTQPTVTPAAIPQE